INQAMTKGNRIRMTKQTSNQNNLHVAQMEYVNQRKSPGVAYAFWFFLGVVGGHRFYAGDTGYALCLLFTLGGLGVWALIDVAFIGRRIREINTQKRQEIMESYGVTINQGGSVNVS